MRKADWLIGFLIAVLVLGAMYYFVKTYKTIQNQQPDRPTVEETMDAMDEEDSATLDEEDAYDEAIYPDESDSADESEAATIDDLADLHTADTGDEEVTTPPSYESVSDANKNYLVVAGTFTQMINAERELKKFRRMGYNDAEIGKFNRSTYASLIVDRFSSAAEANSLVRTLKSQHNIEAYVHQKR